MVRVVRITVLTMIIAALAAIAVHAQTSTIGNLGYNSYEGYMTGGLGQHHYFGPGVGYPAESGDYFRRYFPPEQWGRFGYGTGHLGQGYGPYIFAPNKGGPPPGMFDPLPLPYTDAPPPAIRVKNGTINVTVPSSIPGIRCVTVTVLAFNGAELETQQKSAPPYKFSLPVVDGVKNIRVRIDYNNNGVSATSYAL